MIRVALVLCFSLILRGAEIRNLKWRDANISLKGGNTYLAICIQKSKTDQEDRGVFRSLFRNGTVLRPFDNWETYETEITPVKSDGQSVICPMDILDVVRATIKWIAS